MRQSSSSGSGLRKNTIDHPNLPRGNSTNILNGTQSAQNIAIGPQQLKMFDQNALFSHTNSLQSSQSTEFYKNILRPINQHPQLQPTLKLTRFSNISEETEERQDEGQVKIVKKSHKAVSLNQNYNNIEIKKDKKVESPKSKYLHKQTGIDITTKTLSIP